MRNGGAKKDRPGQAISDDFMNKLLDGGLYAPIVDRVRRDRSLDLQLRGQYKAVDIYFKGKAMRLFQNGTLRIHRDYTGRMQVPRTLREPDDVAKFLKQLPKIKDNMTLHHNKRREAEYEQLIIQENNLERGINSDYVILDRQYEYRDQDGKPERWDLVALRWHNKAKLTGSLAVIEVKYGTASIGDISSQGKRYRKYLKRNMVTIYLDMDRVLKQKLKLRLITRFEGEDGAQRQNLENLKLALNADVFVALVDYNPRGKGVNKATLAKEGVKTLIGGLAMWDHYIDRFEPPSAKSTVRKRVSYSGRQSAGRSTPGDTT